MLKQDKLGIITSGDQMHTINERYTYELIIKNSKFITIMYPFTDNDNLDEYLNKVKKEYPDATHYPYAYITLNKQKSSDDGEPGGTAGIPILKVIETNKLTNVLVVVVRYFGGIKLGAGGLVRAYAKGLSNLIKEIPIKELIKGYNIDITFSYNDTSKIVYLLKDIPIKNKIYDKLITYNLDVPSELLNTLTNEGVAYEIKKETYIIK